MLVKSSDDDSDVWLLFVDVAACCAIIAMVADVGPPSICSSSAAWSYLENKAR